MKCVPITRSALAVRAASRVIEIADVFTPNTQCGGQTESNCGYSASLISRFSVTFSTTKSLSFNSRKFVEKTIRRVTSRASSRGCSPSTNG